MQTPHFEPTWESLKQYRVPEWFAGAKLGIWAHWGPQAVPEVGDWYARNLYIEGHKQYEHHRTTYGHPSKVGYKDIVPLWKAEHFDPDHLMGLYKKAGARYFMALAVHHDNFDCWNSTHHKWNAVNIGPQKDIVGLWRQSALKHGLRFGVTEHLERSYNWFNTNKGADKLGPLAGVPYDGNDPKYKDFYFPPHADTSYGYPKDAPDWWKQQWYARIKDLLDQYQPDALYTDGGVPFGDVGLRLIADYYNQNIRHHDGRLEAVYMVKDAHEIAVHHGYHGEYQPGVGVQDVERGVVAGIQPEPWQTDTCIGGWYYDKEMTYKTATEVIHLLADIVSKNGNLLLNFPPKPDGTLDATEHEVLQGLTDWMNINAEAIHDTRPWTVFGEGSTRFEPGVFAEKEARVFNSQDVRFTRKGDTLYAIALAWPNHSWLIRSLEGRRVNSVTLLGSHQTLNWSQGDDGVKVGAPSTKPCEHAYVLKIDLHN